MSASRLDLVVMGLSAGGLRALSVVLPALPADFSVPVLVVQHRAAHSDDFMVRWLDERCALHVCEAENGMALRAGCIYLAPADYHLVLNDRLSLGLSADDKVNFSRPSIDMMVESASAVFGSHLAVVIMTGANQDGARGAQVAQQRGARLLVQDPADADVDVMPRAALALCRADAVVSVVEIADVLIAWSRHE